MSDRDVLDMDLEDEENEEQLLNETKDDKTVFSEGENTETSIDKHIEKVINTVETTEDNKDVLDKVIENTLQNENGSNEEKVTEDKGGSIVQENSTDDEMDELRKEALKSLDTKKIIKRRDSYESRSNSEDDDLTNMRRELLAQRAQKRPEDLRSKLGRRTSKISAFINPNVAPTKPIVLKEKPSDNVQFANFKVERIVLNSAEPERPAREIISEKKSKFKITRTVKNEVISKQLLIDSRCSSSDEAIEINIKKSKRKSSRSVFQTASEMCVESADDSLDAISSQSEQSDGDQVFILKAGEKRAVTKRKHVNTKSNKKRSRTDSPIKALATREVKSIKHDIDKKSIKKTKMTEKEVELEKKMERIRRDNEKREKRARLMEKEKRKYGAVKSR